MRAFFPLLVSMTFCCLSMGQSGYVQFAAEEFFAYESDGELVVAVERLEGSEGSLSFYLEAIAIDIGATAGDDFDEGIFELVFEDGEDGVKEFIIPIYDDDLVEEAEPFAMFLYDPDDNTPIGDIDFAVGIILDDDTAAPTDGGTIGFSDDQYGALEGDEYVIVEFWRDGPADARLEAELTTFSIEPDPDLPVDLAIEDEDFPKTCMPIVFEPNSEDYMEVIIPINDDDEPERVEFFGVALHQPAENTVIQPPVFAVVGIIDDDGSDGPRGAMRLTQSVYRADEGSELVIGVERIGRTEGVLEAYLVADESGDSAIEDEDFELDDIHIAFQDGESGIKEVVIPILEDGILEGPEYFFVSLIPDLEHGAVVEPFYAEVSIIDNDDTRGTPVFDQEYYYVDESAGTLTVTILREGGTTGALAFWFGALGIDNAKPGEDFTEVRKQLTFPDGSDEPLMVEIPIFDDDIEEQTDGDPAEHFVIGMAWTDNPDEAFAWAPVLILDNDLPDSPGFIVLDSDYYVVDEDDGALVVSAQRVFGKTGRIEAVLTSRPLDAGDKDFEPVNIAIVYEDGETGKKPITLQLINDEEVENEPESFLLVIPQGDDAFEAEVVIRDDDGIDTTIVAPAHKSEHPAGLVTFDAQVAGQTDQSAYSFFWEVCPSTGGDCITQNAKTFEYNFTRPGIYVATCYATGGGETFDVTPDEIGFRINSGGVAARISRPHAKELEIAAGKTIAFMGEASPAGMVTSWYFLSDPGTRVKGTSFRHTFTQQGDYVVIFEAVDPATGESDSDYVEIEVDRTAVGLTITAPADGESVQLGKAIQFRGALTGPQAKRMDASIAWVLSNGARLEGIGPRHTFSKPGMYEVRLIGETADGKRFEDKILLFVEDPSRPAIVDFNFPTDLNISPGQEVFFQARVLENKGYKISDLAFEWQVGNQKSNLATPGNIRFTQPGTFVVSLTARVRATGLRSETVTRTITVAATDDAAFEPNDSIDQATAITPGDYSGLSLDENSATDIYKITVSAQDQRLVFELNPTEPVVAELLDSQQNLLETRTVTTSQNLQLSGLAPGDYFIRLSPVNRASLKRMGGLSYDLSIAVLNPALYLPEIRVDATFSTDVGVVNPTGDTASIQLNGYDSQGNLIKSVSTELPARGRLHQNMEQLFGADAGSITWLQIDSTRDLVGYSRTASRDAKEVYAVSASPRLRSELFVPHIAQQTQQWFTRSSVINGVQKAGAAQIKTPVNTGQLELKTGFSNDRFDYVDRFGGSLPKGADWATLQETSGQPNLAGVEVFGMLNKDTRQIAGLELADVRQDNPNFTYIGNNLYFAHIARNVNQFWTGLALVNIGQTDQTVKIRAFGDGGAELQSVLLPLKAGEKKVQLAEDFLAGIGSPANVDWVLVEADQEIVGYELFGTHDFKKIAGLEAISGLRKSICYPFIDTDTDVGHGIAVVNVNPGPQTVTFTLYANDGFPLASVTRDLAANQKLISTIESLFGAFTFATGQVPGWLECQGTAPLAGFELFLNGVNNEQMGALIAQ